MSGATKLIDRIVSEAQDQAEKVLAEARQRAAEIIDKAKKEAAAREEAIIAAARRQAEDRRRRILTIADLDARKETLVAKVEMIEDTFAQALDRLQKLENSAYQELVMPMLLSAAVTGNEEILVSPADRERYTPEFLAKVNEALKKEGKQGSLTLAGETREMSGGFVLRSGEVEINNSFDSILRMQRDLLEPEVAAILFAE